mmetsp:Transcript_105766/g.297433  ORF Transcript_105766/g.297433 Transcript_105766/m.297433 type:complete len:330 (+) Transcript_105766:227-1216(+)
MYLLQVCELVLLQVLFHFRRHGVGSFPLLFDFHLRFLQYSIQLGRLHVFVQPLALPLLLPLPNELIDRRSRLHRPCLQVLRQVVPVPHFHRTLRDIDDFRVLGFLVLRRVDFLRGTGDSLHGISRNLLRVSNVVADLINHIFPEVRRGFESEVRRTTVHAPDGAAEDLLQALEGIREGAATGHKPLLLQQLLCVLALLMFFPVIPVDDRHEHVDDEVLEENHVGEEEYGRSYRIYRFQGLVIEMTQEHLKTNGDAIDRRTQSFHVGSEHRINKKNVAKEDDKHHDDEPNYVHHAAVERDENHIHLRDSLEVLQQSQENQDRVHRQDLNE